MSPPNGTTRFTAKFWSPSYNWKTLQGLFFCQINCSREKTRHFLQRISGVIKINKEKIWMYELTHITFTFHSHSEECEVARRHRQECTPTLRTPELSLLGLAASQLLIQRSTSRKYLPYLSQGLDVRSDLGRDDGTIDTHIYTQLTSWTI